MDTLANTLPNIDVATSTETVLAFEKYRLNVKRRVLTRNGRRVPLSGRPLLVLTALVEGRGKIVGNRELEALLWPSSYVSDGTLRVHVCRLQKLLGPTENGLRFIENHCRRGYRMSVPVRPCGPQMPLVEGKEPVEKPESQTSQAHLIGRARCIARIVGILRVQPLVTLTGPGGIGKTAVAMAVSRELAAQHPEGLWVVDLATVDHCEKVAHAVAATLGLGPVLPDPLGGVLEFLKLRAGLLVLDNCEHVLGAAAQLAQAVARTAAQVHVLATSREQLYAEGERVYRLEPLEVPALPGPWTRERLLAASAVLLFSVRAAAATGFSFSDEQLGVVAQLCGRLGGNPLAIEIAAARLDLLGLAGLMAALDSGHSLSIVGHRTRAARHWSLRATLDWSYGLLSPLEQTLFRRLGVFCGSFDLAAATEMMAESKVPVEMGVAFEGLLGLTSKSMLAHEQVGDEIHYELHETSRAYALHKLRECGELELIHRRYALASPRDVEARAVRRRMLPFIPSPDGDFRSRSNR